MPLFGKKQQPTSPEPGQERVEELLKRIRERTQQKEKPKDTSVFRGKSSLEERSFMHRLEDPNLYRVTRLKKEERKGLWKKLEKAIVDHRGSIKPKHLSKIETEISQGKWGRLKDLSWKEKIDAQRLIRGLKGTSKR